MAIIAVGGCGAPKPVPPPDEEAKPKQVIPEGMPTTVNAGEGEVTANDPATQKPQWSMAWESGHVSLGEAGDGGTATANEVTGKIMQGGEVVATFSARGGIGDQKAQMLKLQGDVRVKSLPHGSVLTSKELQYDAKLKIIKAKGGVRIVGDQGTIETEAIWATPDLRVIATPELFKP